MAEANIPFTEEEPKTCEEFLKLSDIRQEWIKLIIEDSNLCRSLWKAYTGLKRYYSEGEKGKRINPSEKNILAALRYCAPADVKVIILGQDPVRDSKLATGLAFSFPHGTTEWTIYQQDGTTGRSVVEVHHALRKAGIEPGESLCHEHWAFRGVLLFNVCLTIDPDIDKDLVNPHRQHWKFFTIDLLKKVLKVKDQPTKFVLCWGKQARKVGNKLTLPKDVRLNLQKIHNLQEVLRQVRLNCIFFYEGCHPASQNFKSESLPFHIQAATMFKAIEEMYPGLFDTQDEYAAIHRQIILHNQKAFVYHCKAISHGLLATNILRNFPNDADIDDEELKLKADEHNKKTRTFHETAIKFHQSANTFHKKAQEFHQGAKKYARDQDVEEYHQKVLEYHLEAAGCHLNEANFHQKIGSIDFHHKTFTYMPEALNYLLKTRQLTLIDSSYQSATTSLELYNQNFNHHKDAANYNKVASEYHQEATEFHDEAWLFHSKAKDHHYAPYNSSLASDPMFDQYHWHTNEYHMNEENYHLGAVNYHKIITTYYQNAERCHLNADIYLKTPVGLLSLSQRLEKLSLSKESESCEQRYQGLIKANRLYVLSE